MPKYILKRELYDTLNCKNIVSYDEFKNYFKKENLLYNITSTYFKYIEKIILLSKTKRFTTYQPITSNIQFRSVNESNFFIEPMLLDLLNDFIGKMHSEMIFTLIKYEKSDEEILNFIKLNYNFENRIFNKMYDLEEISRRIVTNTKRININKNKIKILDIGTGSGKKIKEIQKIINNDIKCEIFGADIMEWGPYEKNKKFDFPFKLIQTNPYKIPYSDKMFDCITLILVLHHADNISDILTECYRMLKDDGLLILVEHDVWLDKTHMIIDLQHRIYNKIYNEGEMIKSMYYNYYEWDLIFLKNNFKIFKAYYLNQFFTNRIKYDVQILNIYIKNI